MLFRASRQILKRCFSSYSKVMYESWKKDPVSVHSSWNDYFKTSTQPVSSILDNNDPKLDKEKDLALSAYLLVRYYKVNGHEIAEQ